MPEITRKRPEAEPELATDRIDEIRTRLLAWYDENRRDLPWRRRRDAYGIWVSEIMLQQTRVETVLPHYKRFLDRFPTIEDLAASDLEEVLARWSGLGYYRRARSLHAAAAEVVREHGGDFPSDPDEALALPGIGRYTAGAILSIAYGVPAPIVDGNVIRILSRWMRLDGSVKPAAYWRLAESLVPDSRPGDFNQSMMELGATVCTPKQPRCDECPVASQCEAREAGDPTAYPHREEKRPPREISCALAMVRRNGRLLMVRPEADESSPLAGLWGPPTCPINPNETPQAAVERMFSRIAGVAWKDVAMHASLRHSITNRRYTVFPVTGELRGSFPREDEVLGPSRWLLPAQLTEYPLGGLTLKVLKREEKWSGR